MAGFVSLGWFARWFFGCFIAFLISFAAAGQVTVEVPNGDFEDSTTQNALPDDWTQEVGSGVFQAKTDPSLGRSGVWYGEFQSACDGSMDVRSGATDITFHGWDPATPLDGSITAEVYWSTNSTYYTDYIGTRVGLVFYDAGDNELLREWGSYVPFETLAEEDVWDVFPKQTYDGVNIPVGTTSVAVLLGQESYGCRNHWARMDDVAVVVTHSGGGDPDPDPDDGDDGNPDIPDTTDALDNLENLYDQVCGDIPDLTLAGILPDAWGGAGIGGQIAQIQQNVQQLCTLEFTSTMASATADGLTVSKPYTALPDPTDWGDESQPDISSRMQNVFSGKTYADDTVTALNRQNQMIQFQMMAQQAQAEKVYGRVSDVSASATYDGPLMTETEVGDDFTADFVERDYGQAKERLEDLADASGAAPDFAAGVRSSLLAAPAPASEGSCVMADEVRPPEEFDTLGAAFDVIRYNARVKLSESAVGTFACEIANMPDLDSSQICFGDLVEGEPLCIRGGNAPDVFNIFWLAAPGLVLLSAAVTVLKMFI